MSEEQNPYQPPEAEVADIPAAGTSVPPEPRAVEAGRGFAWLGEAWAIFRQAPLIWIVNFLILFVIMMVLSAIPLVSLLTNLLAPVFLGGLMLGAREIDQGGRLTVGHLFAGFSRRTGALIGVGALYLVMVLVIMFIGMALLFGLGGGMAAMAGSDGPDPAALTIGILVMAALMIPAVMAYWFAPVLVVLHEDVGVVEAMKLSFQGCLKNILPFLLYGILVMVLFVLGAIPFGLGLLIVVPIVFISVYTAYREVFAQA